MNDFQDNLMVQMLVMEVRVLYRYFRSYFYFENNQNFSKNQQRYNFIIVNLEHKIE